MSEGQWPGGRGPSVPLVTAVLAEVPDARTAPSPHICGAELRAVLRPVPLTPAHTRACRHHVRSRTGASGLTLISRGVRCDGGGLSGTEKGAGTWGAGWGGAGRTVSQTEHSGPGGEGRVPWAGGRLSGGPGRALTLSVGHGARAVA